jgi:hypothetical protein
MAGRESKGEAETTATKSLTPNGGGDVDQGKPPKEKTVSTKDKEARKRGENTVDDRRPGKMSRTRGG